MVYTKIKKKDTNGRKAEISTAGNCKKKDNEILNR
jgi:hypothetical protein